MSRNFSGVGGETLNVGIVGCGPAGLATTLFLDRSGHTPTLFDRFDAPAPIGSGLILQPTGQFVLGELGLLGELEARGQPIGRMHGVAMPAGKTVLDIDYAALGPDAHGLAVHRGELFRVLFDAVRKRRVPVRTGIDVAGLQRERDGLWIAGETGEYGPFDLIVDASGAYSRLHAFASRAPRYREFGYGAIWTTVDWPGAPFPEQTLAQRYVGAHTMIGVLPIGRVGGGVEQAAFFWSLRVRGYQRWLERGLDPWKQHVRDIWPETHALLEQIHDPKQMTLARYRHFTLAQPDADGLVFVGDAAHSTSPQLGQGANMALLDAWALGAAIEMAEDIDSALALYARIRRWHVRLFQLASWTLTGFYQSDSRILALVRDLLFDPVSRLRLGRLLVARLVAGTLIDPRRSYGSG